MTDHRRQEATVLARLLTTWYAVSDWIAGSIETRRNTLAKTHTPLPIALRRPWPTTQRGLALWFVSLAVLVFGAVNYVATDLPDTNRVTLELALLILPAHAWGWVMVLVGVFGLYCSYCHLGRDRWGYLALAVFCAMWGSFYLGGWIAFDAPLRGLGGSVTWLLMSALLVAIAGFPNVPLRWADRPGGRNWSSR